MEWKIGEVKQINREWYQCVEANENDNCNSCDLQGLCIRMQGKQHVGNCTNWRTDNKRAIFKKLEKVGRPFERNGYMYQEYKAHTYPLLISESATIPTHNGFAVIIKQNKEDMEEKKLNLKPFDIQKAREGKPVCTRDGRKARIICFDKKCLDEQILIVLVDCGKEESIYFYTTDGKCIDDFSSFDLMMPLEKKEGWVNVYRDCDGVNITKDDNIYSSKDAAISSAQVIDRDNYVATTIIRWEELLWHGLQETKMVYCVRIVINRLRVREYGLKILKIIVLTLIVFVLCLKIGSRKSNGLTKSRENLF